MHRLLHHLFCGTVVDMVMPPSSIGVTPAPSFRAAALRACEHLVLDQLAADFNQRLATLHKPDSGDKVEAVFQSKGKLLNRPKAGASS